MAEIVSQSACEVNTTSWYYVVVRFYHCKPVRRHVHGMDEVTRLVVGLSALAPIRTLTVEEHNPPIGVM